MNSLYIFVTKISVSSYSCTNFFVEATATIVKIYIQYCWVHVQFLNLKKIPILAIDYISSVIFKLTNDTNDSIIVHKDTPIQLILHTAM